MPADGRRAKRTFYALSLVLAFSVCKLEAGATTLFGGVQHTEAMPPVNSQADIIPQSQPYRQLNGMEDSVPQAPRVRIEWYQLPKSMAGKWYKKGDLTVSVTDLRTGMTTPVNRFTDDELVASWGHQYDKQGNIWHANLIPFERDGSTSGLPVRFLIVSLKARLNSPSELISRTHSIITEGAAQSPTKIFQQESLNHYFVSDKEILNRSSNRDFTYEGRPVRDGVLESRFVRVAPFQPIQTLQGIDLAGSLDQYLKSLQPQPQSNPAPTEQNFPLYEPQAMPPAAPEIAPQAPRVPEPQYNQSR